MSSKKIQKAEWNIKDNAEHEREIQLIYRNSKINQIEILEMKA
jgi:hypothetical protein